MEISHIKLSKFKIQKGNPADFQILGLAIQQWSNETKFPIFLFITYPYEIIQEAFIKAQKGSIKNSRYIAGIAKNLK